jgi:hypothetical protein
MTPLRRFARLAGRSMGQSPCFFRLSKPAQAGSEPRPSAPLKGGRTLWPGRAGSTGALEGFTRSGAEEGSHLKSGAHV